MDPLGHQGLLVQKATQGSQVSQGLLGPQAHQDKQSCPMTLQRQAKGPVFPGCLLLVPTRE